MIKLTLVKALKAAPNLAYSVPGIKESTIPARGYVTTATISKIRYRSRREDPYLTMFWSSEHRMPAKMDGIPQNQRD
jgi:hypothetical protein